MGFKFDLGQLADAIHQVSHRIAKLPGDSLLADAGIFNDIVQHGRHQTLMVHMHVREDVRYRERMGNVGFATATFLAIVGLFCVKISPLHQIDLGSIQI